MTTYKRKEDIRLQIELLDHAISEQEKILYQHHSDQQERYIENDLKNRSEQTLSKLCSLIDQYYIFCAEDLGASSEKITKIQYNTTTTKDIAKKLDSTQPTGKKLDLVNHLEPLINKKLAECGSPWKARDINPTDLMFYLLNDPTRKVLESYGITITIKHPAPDLTNETFIFDEKIKKYLNRTNLFWCNHIQNNGLPVRIYRSINNYFKHNATIKIHTEIHGAAYSNDQQTIGYAFFEISNDEYHLINNELIQDLIQEKFDDLKEILFLKFERKNNYISALEKSWGYGDVIKVDTENNSKFNNQDDLCFFVSDIFFVKTKNSLRIDLFKSLITTTRFVTQEIKRRIGL